MTQTDSTFPFLFCCLQCVAGPLPLPSSCCCHLYASASWQVKVTAILSRTKRSQTCFFFYWRCLLFFPSTLTSCVCRLTSTCVFFQGVLLSGFCLLRASGGVCPVTSSVYFYPLSLNSDSSPATLTCCSSCGSCRGSLIVDLCPWSVTLICDASVSSGWTFDCDASCSFPSCQRCCHYCCWCYLDSCSCFYCCCYCGCCFCSVPWWLKLVKRVLRRGQGVTGSRGHRVWGSQGLG